MTRRLLACLLAFASALPAVALAAPAGQPGGWSSLTSDRVASAVGDSVTILVFENASASNSTQSGSKRNTRLSGQAGAGASADTAQLNLGGAFEGNGQTGRAGRMVAQISVTVDEVLPNGDLRISGEQTLNINGETSRIKIRGRVRRADLTSDNTVLSTRLADAFIDYDGAGFVNRSSRSGVVGRIFNWLGVL